MICRHKTDVRKNITQKSLLKAEAVLKKKWTENISMQEISPLLTFLRDSTLKHI